MLLGLLWLTFLASGASAQGQTIYPTDIPGPAGSGAFGRQVAVLANGNIVVADPDYSTPTASKVGAVYLYDGATLALISVLTGSQENDRVGSGGPYGPPGITPLSNGNFVVSSPGWNLYRGAVTWGSGVAGVSGVVSADNSLVGSYGTSGGGDQVGSGLVALSNGNYVVLSPVWGNAQRLGAATWANGATGITGTVSAANSLIGGEYNSFVGERAVLLSNGNFVVRSFNVGRGAVTWGSAEAGLPKGVLSAANSLVGSKSDDRIGNGRPPAYDNGVVPLSNGNYVVVSEVWDNGAAVDAGAVTWGNGAAGTTGVVSSANSLVGTRASDNVGYGLKSSVTPLSNGNYVVTSYLWDSPSTKDVGAITWANGATGRSGAVSAVNSLVGSSTNDWVGAAGVAALANGHYVVGSPYWDNGTAFDAGAVTWGNGATGSTGTISPANSLVGASTGDTVGLFGTVALPNGHYLVRSPNWGSRRGAVTWGNGSTGITGPVSASNSLVGSASSQYIGQVDAARLDLGIVVLSNSNYVVASPYWGSGAAISAGAVTWGSGATGITGEVSAANSLVGASLNDRLGLLRQGSSGQPPTLQGVIPLSNGNYVVGGAFWDNGPVTDAGAVTLANGATGRTGTLSAANSLVGSTIGDQIGSGGVTGLSNGNFVVASPLWDNGAIIDAGAATWGNGATGLSGVVSTANSLVGGFTYDQVGSDGVIALPNGNYLVRSGTWNDPVAGKAEVGALTWGSGSAGIRGTVSAANSLVGSADIDRVGVQEPSVLSNSDYLAHTPGWDNGAILDAGAITWGSGGSGAAGLIGSNNSVLGATANQGNTMTFQAVAGNSRIVVGRDLDRIVTIIERLPRLSVRLAGTGAGAVGSAPAGIACGSDCTETLVHGTVVTLTAAPATGSTFTGWSGACTGVGTCTVTMNGARSVTASFAANTYALSVVRAGDGSGTVSSAPAGIACGSDCTETFVHGTVVTLTAAPATGSTFTGWSGACTGAGTCTVTMDSAKTVTASFAANTYALTVALAGSGSGSVSSAPAGIACGSDCTETFVYGTIVTLTATPDAGSIFAGWGGACTGTDMCSLAMDVARSVTATFTRDPSVQHMIFLPLLQRY